MLIAVVVNLVVMALLVVSVLRRRRADDRSRDRSAAAIEAEVEADSAAVSSQRLSAIVGGPATTLGPVLVPDPATEGDDEADDTTDAEEAPVSDADEAAAPTAGAQAPGTDGTDMNDGTDDVGGDLVDEIGLVRPPRFTMPPVDEPGSGAFAAFLANGGGAADPGEESDLGEESDPGEESDLGEESPTAEATAAEASAAEPPRHSLNGKAADPLTDDASGVDNLHAWTRSVSEEAARSARYGRPVTVVIAELDGMDRLSERFGQEAADRLIPPVADALRRNARAADRVARIGGPRFAVLLTETDEVRAVNYVERVRAACDRWLEAGAIAVRLSIGWASPPVGGDLATAVHEAEERMHREQRRNASWRQDSTPLQPAATPEA